MEQIYSCQLCHTASSSKSSSSLSARRNCDFISVMTSKCSSRSLCCVSTKPVFIFLRRLFGTHDTHAAVDEIHDLKCTEEIRSAKSEVKLRIYRGNMRVSFLKYILYSRTCCLTAVTTSSSLHAERNILAAAAAAAGAGICAEEADSDASIFAWMEAPIETSALGKPPLAAPPNVNGARFL